MMSHKQKRWPQTGDGGGGILAGSNYDAMSGQYYARFVKNVDRQLFAPAPSSNGITVRNDGTWRWRR
ncbi:carbon starvation induced protein CsiD [Salmonella enterica subsp. enterica]|nr:carbon starvation induced protein CsiD [Salmonella enterica subsp. enterica]